MRFSGCDFELRNLFPKGSIRVMSGEDHQKYRRIFIKRCRPRRLRLMTTQFEDGSVQDWPPWQTTIPGNHGPRLRISIVFSGHDHGNHAPHIVRVSLRTTHSFQSSYATTENLGPSNYGIAPEQVEAFFAIRNQVRGFADTIRKDGDGWPPSLLKAMVERNELDEPPSATLFCRSRDLTSTCTVYGAGS